MFRGNKNVFHVGTFIVDNTVLGFLIDQGRVYICLHPIYWIFGACLIGNHTCTTSINFNKHLNCKLRVSEVLFLTHLHPKLPNTNIKRQGCIDTKMLFTT